MNTETYKIAKEILDKYGPAEQLSKPIKVRVYSEYSYGDTPYKSNTLSLLCNNNALILFWYNLN